MAICCKCDCRLKASNASSRSQPVVNAMIDAASAIIDGGRCDASFVTAAVVGPVHGPTVARVRGSVSMAGLPFVREAQSESPADWRMLGWLRACQMLPTLGRRVTRMGRLAAGDCLF